ncbi:MAG: hypothetical protein LBT88_06415 [Oscillospiraceae bacterium]|jgi:hypothetical protein|nr:hypothetical protein [Oscillospiraceae bacterium]
MNTNFSLLDDSISAANGSLQGGDTDKAVRQLTNYCKEVNDFLKFTLENLDKSNFNSAGLAEIGSEALAPIEGYLNQILGQISQIQGSVAALAGRVSTIETQIGLLSAAISAEMARAQTAEGDLTTLTTTDKSSLVAAINELAARIPVIGS